MLSNKNQFPNQIRRLRKKHRLTQKQIILLLHYTDKTMFSKYERGHLLPPLDFAMRLEIELETTIAELYSKHYRELKQESVIRRARQISRAQSSVKMPALTKPTMSTILSRVATPTGQFRPQTILQFQTLQIARKVDDRLNLRNYLVLAEHYPWDVLLKSFHHAANAKDHQRDAFWNQFRQITHQDYER